MKVIDLINCFAARAGQEIEITTRSGKTYRSVDGWRFDLPAYEKHTVFSAEVEQFSCTDSGIKITAITA